MWRRILYLGFLSFLAGVLTFGGLSGPGENDTTSNESGSGESGEGGGSIDPNGLGSGGSIDPDGANGGGDVDPNGHPRS